MLYLAADGGGTKLNVVLFDENLNLISRGVSSGTNTNFRSQDDVRSAMQQAILSCLGSGIKHLDGAAFSIVGPGDLFAECIREMVSLDKYTSINEGQMGVLAGTGEKYGILAQAGTGSDVFYVQPDGNDVIGGWGSVLGDEGSGYDIGIRTLRAAVYAQDGRGPKTEILPIILDQWKLQKLWDLVPMVYEAQDQRRLVASTTKFTAMAAAMGDKVAMDIYRSAAESISHMAVTILDRHGSCIHGSVVVSGGVWKGCPVMFESFSELVHRNYPSVNITLPCFEPVIGGVVLQLLDSGRKKEDFWHKLEQNFAEYKYGYKGEAT